MCGQVMTRAPYAHLQLPDGTTKVILNSKASGKEKNLELKAFLEYINGKKSENEFVTELEQRIAEIKDNDQRRHDYMIMTAFEADAKRMGRLEGKSEGLGQGIADGSRQKALEDAGNLKRLGVSIDIITQATGLTKAEIENL